MQSNWMRSVMMRSPSGSSIDQLIRRKLLSTNSRNDLGALRKAFYGFFEDTLR
jgi:hypothetical protein